MNEQIDNFVNQINCFAKNNNNFIIEVILFEDSIF